jgi:hypothetical protein
MSSWPSLTTTTTRLRPSFLELNLRSSNRRSKVRSWDQATVAEDQGMFAAKDTGD